MKKRSLLLTMVFLQAMRLYSFGQDICNFGYGYFDTTNAKYALYFTFNVSKSGKPQRVRLIANRGNAPEEMVKYYKLELLENQFTPPKRRKDRKGRFNFYFN